MTPSAVARHRKRIAKGDVLITEGDRGHDFYLLEKGVLDVFIQGRKIDAIDAKGSQEFVGEIAALLDEPRTATVIAASDCVVLQIPKFEIEAVLNKSPSLGVKLARSLCKKLAGSSHAHAVFQRQHQAILKTENTGVSLRNYMKGLLALIEQCARSSRDESSRILLDYFLRTNPWGIRQGEKRNLLADAQDPAARST